MQFRAKKIRNKPVINTVNHTAAKLASQQQRIDFLEDRLKRYEEEEETRRLSEAPAEESEAAPIAPSHPIFKNPVFAHTGVSGVEIPIPRPQVQRPSLSKSGSMEDSQWMQYFVDELRSRTIRGTSTCCYISFCRRCNTHIAFVDRCCASS